MTIDRGILGRMKARGEEVLTQVSAELASNPRFARAMEGALRGKQKLEEGVGRALRQMSVPTRSELKRALARIEALEREVAGLKAKSRPATTRHSARKARPKRAASR